MQQIAASKGVTPEALLAQTPSERTRPPAKKQHHAPWWTPTCQAAHEAWKTAQYQRRSHEEVQALKRAFRRTRDRAQREFGQYLEAFRCNQATAQEFWALIKDTIPPLIPDLPSLDHHFSTLHSGSSSEELDP